MAGTKVQGFRKQLKEGFITGEESSRSEEGLLQLLLTYITPRKDVTSLAADLLSEYGSLSSLLAAPFEKLSQCKHINEHGAVLLKLIDWIRHYCGSSEAGKEPNSPPRQVKLFEATPPEHYEVPEAVVGHCREKPIRKYGASMFGKAVLKDAIEVLPRLPDSESLDEIRSFLRTELHHSAEQTRQRYARYITRRLFPQGYADRPLRLFGQVFADTQELREVCFYRFLLAEPLQVEIIEELILPNFGTGRLSRERIRKYLLERFPGSGNVRDCSKAIVDALSAAGIVRADRMNIRFTYREIPIASFAFILHSEFPEPGMYDTRKIEENRMIRSMLWNPERLPYALYELRNRGLISKVSEIDGIRQFTTKYTLEELVERLASGEKKA